MSEFASVHTLRATLRGVRPVVWRQLEVPSSMDLAGLDAVLRTAFGWDGDRPHVFETRGRRFGPPEIADFYGPLLGLGSWTADEQGVTLAAVAPRAGDVIEYVFDVGDRHRIVVETVAAAEPDHLYPQCTGGAGLVSGDGVDQAPRGGFSEAVIQLLNARLRRRFGAVRGRQLTRDDTVTDPAFAGLLPDLVISGDEWQQGYGTPHGPLMPVHHPLPDEGLAACAAACELVRRSVKLATWLGPAGRAVTPAGVLRPAEAVEAAGELGLDAVPSRVRSAKDVWGLHAVWSAATTAGLVDVRGGRARAGAGLALWQGLSVPSARLESWALMFAGMVRAADDEALTSRRFRVALRHELMSSGAVVLYSTPKDVVTPSTLALAVARLDEEDEGDLPVSLLDLPDFTDAAAGVIDDWLVAGILRPAPDPVTGEDERSHGGLAVELAADLREHIGRVDLGNHGPGTLESAVSDILARIGDDADRGPAVLLTPLGAYGLGRLLLAHGWAPPVAGECQDVAPAFLLDALMRYLPDDAEEEFARWITARGGPGDEVMLEVARSAAVPSPEGPARRLMLMLIWAATGPRVRPLMDAVADDLWLSSAVAMTLYATGEGPEPTLAQRLWLAVDGLCLAIGEDYDHFAAEVADTELLDLLRRPGGIEAAVHCDHPRAAEVLYAALPSIEDRALARGLVDALVDRPQARPRLRSVGGTGRAAGTDRSRRRP
jgi:hypothetical protein